MPAGRDALLEVGGTILESVGQVGLSASVRREAVMVAGGHLLGALDAIHVGTALVVRRMQQRRGNRVRFCTGDLRQGEAAASCLGVGSATVLPAL
jgi:hypothetical protein